VTTPNLRYARTSDGAEIAYAVVGDGPPIVMASDFLNAGVDVSIASDAWMAQFEPHHGRSLVMFDWRGLGASPPSTTGFTRDGFMRDLEAVVETVDGAVDVYAASGSGHIAATYAAEHLDRVRQLALIATRPPPQGPRSSVRFGEIAPLARTDWHRFVDLASLIAYGGTSPELVRIVRARMESRLDSGLWDELNDAWEAFDGYVIASHLTMPTLVTIAERWSEDVKSGVRRFVSELPDGRLSAHMVDAVGESPDVTGFQDVMSFFDEERSLMRARDRGGFSTILFTDVVSSTPLLSELRDQRMRAVMRDHDAVCEAAIAEHGGRVVKTIGDAFMAEFSVPSAAIDAAIAIQRGIREKFADSDVPIRLRIGINAGEPIVEDDDLHGASVVIAKRLESEADEGGILVSDVVRQAVAGKDFTFEDRGEAELKGFDQPVRAWAVRWE
jgi:class 3 adenylate cyclase/pimeloyl-ACP methyl ester carboxylesterase